MNDPKSPRKTALEGVEQGNATAAIQENLADTVSDVSEQPTLEQWTALYEVAKHIKKLAPWEYMWESELITIVLPGCEEPVYCSVMGRNGECYAIAVYPGYESVNSFYRLSEAANGNLPFTLAFEQHCLICYFGDREEVTSIDREVYKALGLRFRGRNEWIYFRAIEPGYVPWYIDKAHAELLIQALQNFAMAVMYIQSGKIKVDFDGGETLLRFYSQEKGLWINTVEKMPPRPVKIDKYTVNNALLMKQLKNKALNGASLELDVMYLPTPLQKSKKDRPYLPRMVLLVDKSSGLPLDQCIQENADHMASDIMSMLTNYIMDTGRPASINVRDDITGRFIEDFCRKAGIKLIKGKGVPTIDRLLGELIGVMGGINDDA